MLLVLAFKDWVTLDFRFISNLESPFPLEYEAVFV